MASKISVCILWGFLSLAIINTATSEDSAGNYDSTNTVVSLEAVDRGRRRFEAEMTRTKLPKYGPCWTDALQDLKVGCRLLDASLQSKLALAFTSCYVEMLGFPPYLCDKNTPIEKCVRGLDQRGHDTFLGYFLHTQDMCFYLSSQIWQEETDRTVNQLAFVADGVTKNMAEAKTAQEKILQSQQEALKVQTTLMQDNNALYNAVVRVKQIFDDFRVTADEHQQIFLEIFEKISKVQNIVSWIGGEVSLFDMFRFYIVAVIMGIIATSVKRTVNARFWLVILLTTTFFLERFLTSMWMSLDNDIQLEMECLQQRIWWFRRFASLVGISIVLITAYMYQDYNVRNNHSLNDIQAKLDRLLDRVDKSGTSPGNGPSALTKTPLLNAGTFTDADFGTDDETYSTDTDSDTSGYSEDSESSNDSIAESNEIEFSEQLRLLQEGKEMFPDLDKENNPADRKIANVRDEDLSIGRPVQTSTPKGGIQGDSFKGNEGTPQRYNFRPRKPSTSGSPLLNVETTKAFARKVKESHRKSEKLSVELFQKR